MFSAVYRQCSTASDAHGLSARVRGIAVGDILRRFVSKSLAKHFQSEFDVAVLPHQFGSAAKSGTDGAVHLLRTLTSADPDATVTQIDGIGAFDHARRAKMLGAVRQLPTAHRILPYLKLSYGEETTFLWADDSGETSQSN